MDFAAYSVPQCSQLAIRRALSTGSPASAKPYLSQSMHFMLGGCGVSPRLGGFIDDG
ncbi:MAG: hypothetical protein WEB53_06860 [Akkermansiaceae bacterium]